MRAKDWNRILSTVLLATPVPYVAHAETYLTESQAAAVLFPGVRLTPRWVDLTEAQIKRIRAASGEKPPSKKVRLFTGPHGETVFIDQVLGKHDYITYAVGVRPDGTLQGVEIMEYHETYGYEIRQAAWRRQFVGKSARDPLTLGKDIQNISGATLSSKHVTDGVRRVLATYEVLKS